MGYIIWDVHMNNRTYNFGGSEWVVDGELGRMIYPGAWDKSVVCTYYAHGWGSDHKETVGVMK